MGRKLCEASRDATLAGIFVCRPGTDFREIGTAIQEVADKAGFAVSPAFVGHGIGTYFHGAPMVWPMKNNKREGIMKPGMVFTVEPILVERKTDLQTRILEDGWTCRSLKNSRTAQF